LEKEKQFNAGQDEHYNAERNSESETDEDEEDDYVDILPE